MMINYLIYSIQLYVVIALPHFNLHHTDWINENEVYTTLQHDCLYVSASSEANLRLYQTISYCLTVWPSKWQVVENEYDQKFTFAALYEQGVLYVSASSEANLRLYQTISYCLTVWPSKWQVVENEYDQKFTFAALYEQGVTSEELYFWSASMKLIEDYQEYYNQRSMKLNEIKEPSTIFYKCKLPNFGPKCQYSLDTYRFSHALLSELVYEFYKNKYKATTRTCYTDLKCDRGLSSICLAWYEICDGIVDCFNEGIDEKYCWQLNFNTCNENEYQCKNGQCIPRDFFQDNSYDHIECLDESDRYYTDKLILIKPITYDPMFYNEDIQYIRYKHARSTTLRNIELLTAEIFIETPSSITNDCWLAFKCHYDIIKQSDPACNEKPFNISFLDIINMTCPEQFLIPATPIAYTHIYFLYHKTIFISNDMLTPHYICYDKRYCDGFLSNRTVISFNNLTCRKPEDFPIFFSTEHTNSKVAYYIDEIYKQLYQCNTMFHNNSAICNNSKMYQCLNSSKCISINQLCDGIVNCNNHDDEDCSLINDTCKKGQFKCIISKKCISIHLVGNGNCDCNSPSIDTCTDEIGISYDQKNDVPYRFICDGYPHLQPVLIGNQSETDETECDYWECNNIYTRCNSKWNCWNGADEINCNSDLKCPLNHHQCISSETFKLECLPLEKANDGQIDCVGATDEPKLCRSKESVPLKNFYCKNDTNYTCIYSHELCMENNRCLNGEDKQLCSVFENISKIESICDYKYESIYTDEHHFICTRLEENYELQDPYFQLEHVNFPKKDSTERIKTTAMIREHDRAFSITRSNEQRCHRGLPLHVRLANKNNTSVEACLCPPSYYGETCQYDRQRVSLTLQFKVHSDSRRVLFTFIVSLIDNDNNERTIYSYEQNTYFYFKDCSNKYNIYLLHPKYSYTKNYSIHIDVYEKISLTYRGSFYIPIKYRFLPINRIAVQLTIPSKIYQIKTCSDQLCQHGHCYYYINDGENRTFCQCHQGWYGKYCTIPHTCQCSSNSSCIGVTANNQSVCVCPINKWGTRCFLHSNPCDSEGEKLCLNEGQCIPLDKQLQLSKTYYCLCRKGFDGNNCEKTETHLKLSFHKDISLPQSIIIHFISPPALNERFVANSSVVQRVFLYQKEISVYWPNTFSIVFVQLLDKYYLVLVQNSYDSSIKTYNQIILPSYRCRHVSEILNETILSLHPFRRVKYFQIPCEQYASDLNCFYDDTYFCLCYNFTNKRLSNCFNFDSRTSVNCQDLSDCENGGKCVQDGLKCPKKSICVCPKCFHGRRCQFNSHLFGLSLDAILGYHIQPYIKLTSQPFIIKLSLILTIIITILGIINSILSLMVFKSRELRKSGCSVYLLGSSLTTLFTIIIFLLKFSIFLHAQMTYMTNSIFLNIQCYTLDFCLRIGLCMDQYLNACVASERALTAFQGVRFNKEKSQQMAKYIIILILFWTITTAIHDPIHRQILHDNDDDAVEDNEKRIWCIASYSSNFRIFNSIINLIHFFVPFVLNLMSALIIIFFTSQKRKKAQKKLTYRQIIKEQIQDHLHLLIAPVVLVLLAFPRLILSFIATCMNSSYDVWLPLIGYFISCIPPLLTFIIFVMPSKLYMSEFKKTSTQIQTRIRSCFL
ncbi:unnamed protein product [Adineta ricciae]|uniref:Uncharacterized protein n=2 Tax=Adineta ricciae TaxID=249248 RepID=A0A815C2Z4_ADIRI|nr:unnamed protein product [Adineta ricciae]